VGYGGWAGQGGFQFAMLRVASPDGGFLVFASTPSRAGDELRPDDLVFWVPSTYSDEAGSKMDDPRSGWIGLIRAKILPQIDMENPKFAVACRFE
jgi:hypothetical protein